MPLERPLARPLRPELADAAEAATEEPATSEFDRVQETLLTALDAVRPDVRVHHVGSPAKLAPRALALAGTLPLPGRAPDEQDPAELATGRLVVLHDPDGQDAWQGTYRIACYARATLEPEMVTDPVLPDVTWSWLIEALEQCDARHGTLAGTVTTTASARFGELADDGCTYEVELRCSWSPRWEPDDPEQVLNHLHAFCHLLGSLAGQPPLAPGVVPLPGRLR